MGKEHALLIFIPMLTTEPAQRQDSKYSIEWNPQNPDG